MQSKYCPKEIKWEDWKYKPVVELPENDSESRWSIFGIVDTAGDDFIPVEFYKSEHIYHSRKFFNEFLYEYQQVLKYEEFQYKDFPQVLDMGPDYLAWIDWIERECKLGRRISYAEYAQPILERRKEIEYAL